MRERLTAANAKQADAPLAEVESLLNTLAKSWEGVKRAEGAKRAACPSTVCLADHILPETSSGFPHAFHVGTGSALHWQLVDGLIQVWELPKRMPFDTMWRSQAACEASAWAKLSWPYSMAEEAESSSPVPSQPPSASLIDFSICPINRASN